MVGSSAPLSFSCATDPHPFSLQKKGPMESNTLVRKGFGGDSQREGIEMFSGSVLSGVPVVCQAPALAFCPLVHLALAPALSVTPSSMTSSSLSCNPVISQSCHLDSAAPFSCTGRFLVGTASFVREIQGSRSKNGAWTSFT